MLEEIKSISTDCRSDVGITMGLVDSVIVTCRILARRELSSIEVQAALEDLQSDEDLRYIMAYKKKVSK